LENRFLTTVQQRVSESFYFKTSISLTNKSKQKTFVPAKHRLLQQTEDRGELVFAQKCRRRRRSTDAPDQKRKTFDRRSSTALQNK